MNILDYATPTVTGFFVGLIGSAFGFWAKKNQNKTSLEAAKIKKADDAQARQDQRDDDKLELFVNKVYEGWDKLNSRVDTLLESNIKLSANVSRLEGAETRLTAELGGVREQNKILQHDIETARIETAETKLRAEAERRLFDTQRKAWGEWSKKILTLIKEAGVTVPDDLMTPPY